MNNQKKKQYPIRHPKRDSKYLNYQIKTLYLLCLQRVGKENQNKKVKDKTHLKNNKYSNSPKYRINK